jgi:hypothetical protein
MARYRFTARVHAFGPDGAYVEIPGDAAGALGVSGRLSVRARVNGVEVRKSMARRPGGVYRMSLSRAVRAEAKADPGQEVEIELELDDS